LPGFTPPPAPAVVLEGDYSDWTEKWATSMVNRAYPYTAIFNEEADRIVLYAYECYAILKLSDGEKIEEVAWTKDSRNVERSVLERYLAFIKSATEIVVFKDGSLKQTITKAGADWTGLTMSANGKYILSFNFNDSKLYLFEGS